MGILNVTPDSFSDGSRYNQMDKALAHAEQMLEQGAQIIDIGGESTRPGAQEVDAEEECGRVIPLITRLKALGAKVSIDTSKPEVMLAAADAGADMLNDVRALSLPGALTAAARCQLPICLMHMQGQPQSMQEAPQYRDVVAEVVDFLRLRIEACEQAGISRSMISIDPGFGFGKTLDHNLLLLTQLERFGDLNQPILIGISRKSMLGQITGREVHDRMPASIAAALIAMQKGARIIRVHDVAETIDAKKVFVATQIRRNTTNDIKNKSGDLHV